MWSAYLDESLFKSIPEREELFKLHEHPSHFTIFNQFYVFVEQVANPVDAIDASKMTTEELIDLVKNHKTPNAVLITKQQTSQIYKLMHVEEEEEMV